MKQKMVDVQLFGGGTGGDVVWILQAGDRDAVQSLVCRDVEDYHLREQFTVLLRYSCCPLGNTTKLLW